ncbi:MAG: hypothetical protein HOC09_20405 [Deltaproteobacteria bacterium]|nr:hypothetical protein [Deltaproteobacteria bacterium]
MEASIIKAIHPVIIKEGVHQDFQFIHKLSERINKIRIALSSEEPLSNTVISKHSIGYPWRTNS